MFNNLPIEVFYFSLIPAVMIALVALFIFIFLRKKENIQYKYNYIMKVLLIIMISFVLPVIVGYSVWRILRYISLGILLSKIVYVIILCILIIALIILLIIICRELYKSLDDKKRVS